jgi:predicted signal transduction protein with EAL and GGDEF domain
MQYSSRSIIRAISAPYLIEDETVEIGASVGIAVAAETGSDADTLLHQADIALYRVKAENGRNFRFFAQDMDHALRERREMKRELASALVRNELSLVYQPQIDVR